MQPVKQTHPVLRWSRVRHPVVDRVVGPVRELTRELARAEVIDRSMALGAQGLLAAVPLLMVVAAFSPTWFGSALLAQLAEVVGIKGGAAAPLENMSAADIKVETGAVGALVVLLSASSFARALQRMYARVWDVPAPRGFRAFRSGLLWLVGWLMTMQATLALVSTIGGFPLSVLLAVPIQLALSALIWWWSAHELLNGAVSWVRLLPQAVVTSLALFALIQGSALVMPRFARQNVEQFGLLGLVFSTASWLVCFGGVLVVSAVLGRMVGQGRAPRR